LIAFARRFLHNFIGRRNKIVSYIIVLLLLYSFGVIAFEILITHTVHSHYTVVIDSRKTHALWFGVGTLRGRRHPHSPQIFGNCPLIMITDSILHWNSKDLYVVCLLPVCCQPCVYTAHTTRVHTSWYLLLFWYPWNRWQRRL